MQTFADAYKYRFVLANLVGKELKALYRNQALGFLWTLLNPLVLLGVLTFVWVVFFDAGIQFPAMVLVALVPYNFFSYCLSGCSHSILANANLIKKVHFPRQIVPFSVVATHSIHFLIQFLLVLIVVIVLPGPGSMWTWNLLWLPVILVVQFGLCVGCGLLVAGTNVIYRDVQYLVDSILTILFWACPIVYLAGPKLADQPIWVSVIYYCNPLAGLLEAYRAVLYHGTAPNAITFGASTALALLLGALGIMTFFRHEREFADLI